MHTALRLERLLRPGEATVMVAGPRAYMTYQPLMNRRLRVVADWTLALLFPREVVSLDVLEPPRQDFQAALHVIAAGPSGATPIPGRGKREAEDHAYHR